MFKTAFRIHLLTVYLDSFFHDTIEVCRGDHWGMSHSACRLEERKASRTHNNLLLSTLTDCIL